MFTSRLVTLAFVSVFVVVNVMAIPMPHPPNVHLGHALAQRNAAPFEPILAYMKRDTDLGKRDDGINHIPEETPTQSPKGTLELFGRDSIPAEVAVKAPDGVVVPFTKRDDGTLELFGRDSIPAEVAVKAPDGVVVPFTKRDDGTLELFGRDSIPAEVAVKAPDGVVVPFTKRDDGINHIPEETPTQSPKGTLELFGRDSIPAEVAVKAPNGQVELFSRDAPKTCSPRLCG